MGPRQHAAAGPDGFNHARAVFLPTDLHQIAGEDGLKLLFQPSPALAGDGPAAFGEHLIEAAKAGYDPAFEPGGVAHGTSAEKASTPST